MPGGDQTGPRGEGPITGRGMGFCSGSQNQGNYSHSILFGRGLARGFRRGARQGMRGYFQRRNFSPVQNDQLNSLSEETIIENEIRTMKEKLEILENQLNKIKSKD